MPTPPEDDLPYDFSAARERMVTHDLAGRDIHDTALLDAFRKIPRHRFVPPIHWDEAYADHPLAIASGQTISQPYIVAFMTQLLQVQAGLRVLEIGTGSGYQTAVLACLGAEVHTVERHENLTEAAAQTLADLELDATVTFHIGDGTLGVPEEAPFDRILVTAAAPDLPPPLKAQLSADNGRLVAPVGRTQQQLLICTRHGADYHINESIGVIFVPLIGAEGF